MNKHALVVDDSRLAAESLAKMVNVLGVATTIANGSRDVIARLTAGETYDVIFLDVNMPGVTGLEVIAFIRRDPRTANMPIVVVSGETQPVSVHKALHEAKAKFIPKPVSFDALEATLKAIFPD